MKLLTPYLHVGEPSDADQRAGFLFEPDPRKAAAAILNHVPVVVPTDAHADRTLEAMGVTRGHLPGPPREGGNPFGDAGGTGVKTWDEADHPRDDHGRFADSGGGGYVIEATNPEGGYHARDLQPYVGKQVTVTQVAQSGAKYTTTGTLTGAERGNLGNSHFASFAPGASYRAEESTGVREAVLNGLGSTRINPTGMGAGSTFTVTTAEKAPDVRPDDRVYNGRYPAVDAAIKDARAILLRQGPETPQEAQARGEAWGAHAGFLQQEMNSSLYGAWQMARSGTTPPEWAATRFRQWYTTESMGKPMMAAYGGHVYAGKVANAIERSKQVSFETPDGKVHTVWELPARMPQPKDDNQRRIYNEALSVHDAANRQMGDGPLATRVAGYLSQAAGRIAVGKPPPPVDADLLHDLRQQGFRVGSVAAMRGNPNFKPIEQLSGEHLAALAGGGLRIPEVYPTGRAILAEQAIRKVGEQVDAAIDAEHPELAPREREIATAQAANRAATVACENNLRLARATTQKMIDEFTERTVGSSPTDRYLLAQRWDRDAERGAAHLHALVDSAVSPGAARDAAHAIVDANARKLDGYATQFAKGQEIMSKAGPVAFKADEAIRDRRDATAAVLAAVRPFGSEHTDAPIPVRGASVGRGLMDSASKYFPAEWLDHAATGPPVTLDRTDGRASWDDKNNVLAFRIAAPAVRGDADGEDVMVHEMAHLMESRVPGIMEAEHAHWWSRCADEPTVSLAVASGRGYGAAEMTRPDRFFDSYAGKIYGAKSDSHYELLSCGMQAVAGGAFGGLRGLGVDRIAGDDPVTGRAPFNRSDDDLRRFALGTIATV